MYLNGITCLANSLRPKLNPSAEITKKQFISTMNLITTKFPIDSNTSTASNAITYDLKSVRTTALSKILTSITPGADDESETPPDSTEILEIWRILVETAGERGSEKVRAVGAVGVVTCMKYVEKMVGVLEKQGESKGRGNYKTLLEEVKKDMEGLVKEERSWSVRKVLEGKEGSEVDGDGGARPAKRNK